VKDRRRLLLTLALVFVGLCGLLAIGALIVVVKVVIPMLRERVVSEARVRGIELGFDDVEVSFSHLSIQKARFRLVGVRGVAGTVDRIDVTTKQFEPTGIHLENLHLELLGSVQSLAVETAEWAKTYPEAFALPLSAKPVSARLRSTLDEPAWLSLSGGQVGHSTKGGSFEAATATLAGITVGPVGTSWTKDTQNIELGLGKKELSQAPLTIKVVHTATKPSATISLKPSPADQLAAPLGVKLPVTGVTLSALTTLQFGDKYGALPITGEMQVTLDGYVPPHPPELGGFVFGNSTSFTTKFRMSADKKTVDMSETQVTAGAFKLKGSGQAQRFPDHARVRFELTGFLNCVDLASAAAETHLGQVLSKLPKLIAKQALQGSVGVTVKVDADTRDLENAKVLKLIGIGCGLQPLRVPTPEELEAFAKALPGFVGELPTLAEKLPEGLLPKPSPSGFVPPALPLPRIEFEKREASAPPKPVTGTPKQETGR